MLCDKTNALVSALTARLGTLVHPKSDGRIEIPRSLVRLMGWENKQTILITRLNGYLELSVAAPIGVPIIGRVSISMERARIPMSMLRMAGMNRCKTLVISAGLNSIPSLSVRPWIIDKQDELYQIIDDAGPQIRDRLYSILVDHDHQTGTSAGPPVVPVSLDPGPWVKARSADRLLSVPMDGFSPDPGRSPCQSLTLPRPPVDELESTIHSPMVDKAKLFLPEFSAPTVVRVIGSPFAFQSHWVAQIGGGTIIPHRSSECKCCGIRAPDRMYLIPIIRRKESLSTGYLLVKEELRAKIGRALAGSNPTLFDLILYYKPFVDGMFDVYRNPPEPMPDGLVECAQTACGDPNTFLANTFPEQEGFAVPSRMPALLVPGNFAANKGTFGK